MEAPGLTTSLTPSVDRKPALQKNLFGSIRNLSKLKTSMLPTTPLEGLDVGSPLNTSMSAGTSGDDYFSEENLNERLKQYVKKGGIPVDYIEKYAEYAKTRTNSESK